MAKYEDMVYRCPGPLPGNGFTWATKGVKSKEEHEQALKDGWFRTLPEAVAGKHAVIEKNDDKRPPTRAELEQKAAELNIKFDKKTTDKALGDLITKALGA
jgi:hypothetical protein